MSFGHLNKIINKAIELIQTSENKKIIEHNDMLLLKKIFIKNYIQILM